MSEEVHGVGTEGADVSADGANDDMHGGAFERTGVPSVDRVIAEVRNVGELPVAERVAVFERVHEQLRKSLDANPSTEIAGA